MASYTSNTSAYPLLLKAVTEALDKLTKNSILFSAYDVTKVVRNEVTRQGNKFYAGHADVRDIVHEFYEKELPPFQNGSDYIRDSYVSPQGLAFQVYRPIGSDINSYDPSAIKTGTVALVIPSKNLAPLAVSKGGHAVALNPTKPPIGSTTPSVPVVATQVTSKSTVAPTAPVAPITPIAPSINLNTGLPNGMTAWIDSGWLKRGSRGRALFTSKMVSSIGLVKGDLVDVYAKQKSIILQMANTGLPDPSAVWLGHVKVDKYNEVRIGANMINAAIDSSQDKFLLYVNRILKTLTIQ
jgi:hypothetical protein